MGSEYDLLKKNKNNQKICERKVESFLHVKS